MSSAPVGDPGVFEGLYSGFGSDRHGFRPGVPIASVVLDGRMEGLDTATKDMPKRKGASDRDEKAAMALKSHSEAERRRRERINAHLATLRRMVPCADHKLDKAALLAEVINHLKKLKSKAAQISKACSVPSETDEVTVEAEQTYSNNKNGHFLIKASLSCDDSTDLFIDVKQALQRLKLKVVGTEVTTLGGRVRLTFLIMTSEDDVNTDSVRQALKSVLDKVSSAFDFAPRDSLLNKRRRISTFESSTSSS